MDAKGLGRQIRKYRRLRNMTGEQLAEVIAVDPTTVRQYENGYKTPRLARLIDIANALNVSMDELLFQTLKATQPVVLQGIAKKLEPLTPEQTASLTKIIDVLLANKEWL